MNIESSNINRTNQSKQQTQSSSAKNSSVKFADELNGLKESKNKKSKEINKEEQITEEKDTKELKKNNKNDMLTREEEEEDKNIENSEDKINESMNSLSDIVKELNQSEEKDKDLLKNSAVIDDKTLKGDNLINNDYNIQENKDLLPQMNQNMNFSGDGQPFSSFMGNNENNQNSKNLLNSTATELSEEAEILSTMAENIALANKNSLLQNNEKTVNKEEGIKKVDIKTGITVENVVKYDSIIMNEADVEVFASLVENGEANLENLSPQSAQKSVQISKTLADMLAKSKETQQPLRIDFDNGISVIIKVSREGKLSADFLPSTQIAETYLKENLPLLKQRFDEKNLDYDELNQRGRRNQDKDDNRKKGRNNE